ncbi:MAG: cadherin-like beta sandwich domain-containing protein, partial [Desulfuromonadales bacterium]|nr:cadherin-like beta sandwich domain-containing protein [Desulfuromonadales bacterium]
TYDGITVANAVSSITVTPTGAGTITVDGTPVTSGSASAAINLTAGVEKTITVVVTETGKTPKTYTLKVTRDNPTLTFSIKSVVPKSESYNFGQDTYYYHVVTLKVDDGQGGAIQSSPSTPDVNNSIRVSTTEGASAAWPEYSVNGNEFTFETGGFLSFNSVNSVTIYAGAFTSTNGITTTSAKTVYP